MTLSAASKRGWLKPFSYTFTLAQNLQRLHRETYTEPFKAFLETARLFALERVYLIRGLRL